MSDVATKRDTFRDAVEILVQREVANSQPANPGAYAGSVRSRLLNDKRDHARALMEEQIPTPEQLAEMLDDTPVVAASKPTVRYHADKNHCTNCGCYGGGGWMPAPERDDLGIHPDLIPCPTCAVDRHRLHARDHVREDRTDVFDAYASATSAYRERHADRAKLASKET